jgi:hypothetical protein
MFTAIKNKAVSAFNQIVPGVKDGLIPNTAISVTNDTEVFINGEEYEEFTLKRPAYTTTFSQNDRNYTVGELALISLGKQFTRKPPPVFKPRFDGDNGELLEKSLSKDFLERRTDYIRYIRQKSDFSEKNLEDWYSDIEGLLKECLEDAGKIKMFFDQFKIIIKSDQSDVDESEIKKRLNNWWEEVMDERGKIDLSKDEPKIGVENLLLKAPNFQNGRTGYLDLKKLYMKQCRGDIENKEANIAQWLGFMEGHLKRTFENRTTENIRMEMDQLKLVIDGDILAEKNIIDLTLDYWWNQIAAKDVSPTTNLDQKMPGGGVKRDNLPDSILMKPALSSEFIRRPLTEEQLLAAKATIASLVLPLEAPVATTVTQKTAANTPTGVTPQATTVPPPAAANTPTAAEQPTAAAAPVNPVVQPSPAPNPGGESVARPVRPPRDPSVARPFFPLVMPIVVPPQPEPALWDVAVGLSPDPIPTQGTTAADLDDARDKELRLLALTDPISLFLKLAAGSIQVEMSTWFLEVPIVKNPSKNPKELDLLRSKMTAAAHSAFVNMEEMLSKKSGRRLGGITDVLNNAGLVHFNTLRLLCAQLVGVLYKVAASSDPRRSNPTRFNLQGEKKLLADVLEKIDVVLRQIYRPSQSGVTRVFDDPEASWPRKRVYTS